jgi:hypothetical protein
LSPQKRELNLDGNIWFTFELGKAGRMFFDGAFPAEFVGQLLRKQFAGKNHEKMKIDKGKQFSLEI